MNIAKLAGEEYLRGYNRLQGSTHVALRYGNVYGPRQDPHGEAGVVAIFLGALASGESPKIFGEGTQTRDYVYVGDVARATLQAQGQEGGVFNVGTGRLMVAVVNCPAAKAGLRLYQYTCPLKWLPPDLVVVLMTPPPV